MSVYQIIVQSFKLALLEQLLESRLLYQLALGELLGMLCDPGPPIISFLNNLLYLPTVFFFKHLNHKMFSRRWEGLYAQHLPLPK